MSGKSRRPQQGLVGPTATPPTAAEVPQMDLDPSLYGNSFVADQMLACQPHQQSMANDPRETKRMMSIATALPKANNLSRLGKAANTVSQYQKASEAAKAINTGGGANHLIQAQKSREALKAMQDSKGAGFLKKGSRLGNIGKAAGIAGGVLNMASGGMAIANGKDRHGEKYVQVAEGAIGTAGAASGNPYLASAATGMMLGRSSNDYYRKHTGKSVSEWVGDAGAAVYSGTSSGIKDAAEGTWLEGAGTDLVADGLGMGLGGLTVLGGSVVGAAASVGGGLVGLADGLFGD